MLLSTHSVAGRKSGSSKWWGGLVCRGGPSPSSGSAGPVATPVQRHLQGQLCVCVWMLGVQGVELPSCRCWVCCFVAAGQAGANRAAAGNDGACSSG